MQKARVLKTISEWLAMLPADIREKALMELPPDGLGVEASTLSKALHEVYWCAHPVNNDYWRGIIALAEVGEYDPIE